MLSPGIAMGWGDRPGGSRASRAPVERVRRARRRHNRTLFGKRPRRPPGAAAVPLASVCPHCSGEFKLPGGSLGPRPPGFGAGRLPVLVHRCGEPRATHISLFLQCLVRERVLGAQSRANAQRRVLFLGLRGETGKKYQGRAGRTPGGNCSLGRRRPLRRARVRTEAGETGAQRSGQFALRGCTNTAPRASTGPATRSYQPRVLSLRRPAREARAALIPVGNLGTP